ncbi:hypothetical protein O7626_03650 [Micromonospora sp. WMMD1102]|uniref:hypothetical protein n=1 Tax=Micromonospora sp. WMMD1102 TaxID=3016105 RepID=UPI002414D714|nr:hypothetical protein [Micromonospora sp. WMMD1102]MDG4785035.1 hypothetical protein [Micromonospora sp. WMMD1102]
MEFAVGALWCPMFAQVVTLRQDNVTGQRSDANAVADRTAEVVTPELILVGY